MTNKNKFLVVEEMEIFIQFNDTVVVKNNLFRYRLQILIEAGTKL